MKADEKARLRKKDGFRTWQESAIDDSRRMLWHLPVEARPTDLAKQRAITEEFLTRWRGKHDTGNVSWALGELATSQSAWFGCGYRRAVFFPDLKLPTADTSSHASVCGLAVSLGLHLPTVWEAVRLLANMREPFNPIRENAVVVPCSQVCEDGRYYYLMITAQTHQDDEGDLVVDKWVMKFVPAQGLTPPIYTRWLFIQDPSVGFIEGWLRRR